jgi:tetratricopeptide (TPR) repeat protein
MKKKMSVLCMLLLIPVGGIFAADQSLEALERFKAEGAQLYEIGDYRAAQKTWEVGLDLSRTQEEKDWEAQFLLKLAELQGELGNYPAAFESFEKSGKLAKSQKDESLQVESYLKTGRIYAKLGQYKEAFEYNKKAMDIYKKLDQKEGQAAALSDLGEYYADKGEYKDALSCVDEASRVAALTGDQRIIGENMLQLSRVNNIMGNFDKARASGEQTLGIFNDIGYSKGAAEAALSLGRTYSSLGNYGKAASMFENALDISEKNGYRTIIERALAGLAMVYKNSCDYSKALIYLDNSISYSKESGSKAKLLDNFYNFGYLYKSLGYYGKAQGYFSEAINILREMGDKNGLLGALIKLGNLDHEIGEYNGALACFQEASKIKDKMGLPFEDITARIFDIYLDMGNIEQAEKTGGKKMKDPFRLGRAKFGKKAYTLAKGYFEEALQDSAIYNKLDILFPLYCAIAESHFGLWEYDKAKEFYNNAITVVEAQLEGGNDDEKYDFYSRTISGFTRSHPYEGMIKASIKADDAKGAFVLSEKLKLDIFAQAAARKIEFAKKELSDENAKKEAGFINKIALLRREMNAANRKVDYSSKEKELNALKDSHDIFIEGLRQSSPRFTSIKYPRAMKLQDINIKPNEVLVEFEVTSDVTYLFEYDGYDRHFNLRPIGKTRKELKEMINKFNQSFKRNEATGKLAVFDTKFANEVYETIFGDILDGLPKDVNLIIVPDESLGALPFGSLVVAFTEAKKGKNGKGGTEITDVEYLADNYLITYAQSATGLTYFRAQKQEPSREASALAVCNPVFTPSAQANAGSENLQSNMIEAISWWRKAHGNKGAFEGLEPSESAGKYFESILPGKTTVLSGGQATEDAVTNALLSRYKYITFGTHAVLDSSVPWLRQPAVVLSQTGNEGNSDGYLTLDEIMLMKIPAEAVTLPDCEMLFTGPNLTGEYAMDMAAAFQCAGAKNVLMSFWANDDAAYKFNNSFIKNLKEGKEPAEALNAARREIIESGFGHPYYWANFILAAK